jgi:uncharacterized RDD family membrane protein YckC
LAAAVRLSAFLLLVAVLFVAAYLAGADVGPVTVVHGHSGPGSGSGSGGMHMGSAVLSSARSSDLAQYLTVGRR